MTASTTNLDRYVPDFKVEIGGKEQSKFRDAVISLEVDENLDNPSMFTINLNEGFDLEHQKLIWLDNDLILPEKNVIKIYMGYANDPEKFKEPVITGRIIALNPSFPSNGTPTLSVQGYDYSFQFRKTLVKEKRPFETIEDYKQYIMSSLNPINPELNFDNIKTNIKPCKLITPHSNESHYDFIKRMAIRVGYEFFIRNENVYFREPQFGKDEVTTLKWGNDLINFNPRLSTAGVVNKVTIRSHNQFDPKNAIKGVVKASEISDNEPKAENADKLINNQTSNSDVEINKNDFPVCDNEDAKLVAKALLLKSNNNLIEANCECIGIPGLRPGQNIMIDGVGQRFNGKYYVKGIKHSMGDGGYRTSFEIRRGAFGNTGSNGQ